MWAGVVPQQPPMRFAPAAASGPPNPANPGSIQIEDCGVTDQFRQSRVRFGSEGTAGAKVSWLGDQSEHPPRSGGAVAADGDLPPGSGG